MQSNTHIATLNPALSPEKDAKSSFQSTRFEQSRVNFEAATDQFTSGSSDVLDYLTAKINFDNTCLEYDETGAFVLAGNESILQETFLGDKNLEIDPKTGMLRIEVDDKNKVLFGATLPSLPIINSKEGHVGGNKALQRITKIAEISGPQNMSPVVMHVMGADFRFGVNARNLDEIAQFDSEVLSYEWPKIEGTNENPYLVLEKVSLAETLEAFNRLQILKAILSPEDVITNEGDIEKELLQISSDILNYKVEYSKAMQMCNRFWDAYSHSSSAEYEDHKTYFNSYLKAYFQPIGINTFEEMQTFVASNPQVAFDNVAWRRAESGIGQDDLIRNTTLRRFVQSKTQETHNGVEESAKRELNESGSIIDLDIQTLEAIAAENPQQFIFEEKSADVPILEIRAPRPEDTQSYINFYEGWQDTKVLLTKLRTGTVDSNIFESLIDLSGLNTEEQIGEATYNIAEDLRNLMLNPYPQKIEKFATLIEARYQNLYRKLDQLTAVPNRESFYQDISETLHKDILAGRKTVLAFIDLAFLNYFNKKGGRDLGDVAIKQSIAQLEEMALDTSLETGKLLNISRYAGDEIVISGEDIENEVENGMRRLNREARVVPGNSATSPNYIPAPIQYNYGIADIYTAEECMATALDEKETTSENEISKGILQARKPQRVVDTIYNFNYERYANDPNYAETLKQDFAEFKTFLEERTIPSILPVLIEDMTSHNDWANVDEMKISFEAMQSILNEQLAAEINAIVYEDLTRYPEEALKQYADKLSQVMVLVSDAFVDDQKAHSRFDFLFAKFMALTDEQRANQESQEYVLLQNLVTFSGKSLRGLDIDLLDRIAQQYNVDGTKYPWDYYKEIAEASTPRVQEDNQQPKSLRSTIISKVANKINE